MQNAIKWDLWGPIWTVKTICSMPSTALRWIIQAALELRYYWIQAKGNPWITFYSTMHRVHLMCQTFCYLTTIWTFDFVHFSHYLSVVRKLGWNLFKFSDTSDFLCFHFLHELWSENCCYTQVDSNNTEIRKFKHLIMWFVPVISPNQERKTAREEWEGGLQYTCRGAGTIRHRWDTWR